MDTQRARTQPIVKIKQDNHDESDGTLSVSYLSNTFPQDRALSVTLLNDLPGENEAAKLSRLFHNPIDTSRGFGITRNFADNYRQLLDGIRGTSSDLEGTVYESEDGRAKLRIRHEVTLSPDKFRSGKSLQTLLALWEFANQQGSFYLNSVRLDELMSLVLKKPKSGYFTKDQRRTFTTEIHNLRSLEVYLDIPISPGTKGRGRREEINRRYFRLLSLEGSTHSKKRDPETNKWVIDDSVIHRLSGEILPGINKGIGRGRVYSHGLLEMDANKDEAAIMLGFAVQTRFDQLRQGKNGLDGTQDKDISVSLDRKRLIEMAGYQRTDGLNKNVASQYLQHALNKLVEHRCLASYSPKSISTIDNQRITLKPYPVVTEIDSQRLVN